MGNLVVRNIDDNCIKALKARAGKRGISAEVKRKKILQSALARQKESFYEVLQSIPAVGDDADFERIQQDTAHNVFD